MTSRASSFNKTLILKNLQRFWVLGFLHALALFLILSYPMLINASADFFKSGIMTNFLQASLPKAGYIIFASSIFIAMAIGSYMNHESSVGMIHSLPLTRKTVFFSNYVSGLALLILPLAINGVVLSAVHIIAKTGWDGQLLVLAWFVFSVIYALLFYSFAVFVGIFTGNTIAQGAYYFILNFLPQFITVTCSLFLERNLFGYAGTVDSRIENMLSPVSTINRLATDYKFYSGATVAFAVYVLVAALLTAAAIFFFSRRRLETAGDAVSFNFAKPIFKYGVTVCSTLLIGEILSGVSNIRSIAINTLFYLFGGFVGYFAAEMFLQKTVRVFKRYKGYVAFAAIVVLLAVSVNYDLFGYESRLPALDDVETVYVGESYGPAERFAITRDKLEMQYLQYLPDIRTGERLPQDEQELLEYVFNTTPGIFVKPQDIENVIKLHEFFIGLRDSAKYTEYAENLIYVNRYFAYRLKNGRVIERKYFLRIPEDKLEALQSLSAEVCASEDYARKKYAPIFDESSIRRITIMPRASKTGTPIDLLERADIANFAAAFRRDLENKAAADGIYPERDFVCDVYIDWGNINTSFSLNATFKETIDFLVSEGYATTDEFSPQGPPVPGKELRG